MTNFNLLQETEESTLLHTYTNANIANFITHEACQKYFNKYKNCWIPSSFIEFYFEEYRRYDFMSPEYLTPFFELYHTDDISDIIENYYYSHYSLIKKKMNKSDELHYLIDTESYYFDSILYEHNILGAFDESLYNNLGFISKHINNSDELLTIKEHYEYYMLKKIILSQDEKKTLTIKTGIKEPITTIIPKKEDAELVGLTASLPKQSGKVNKLFFPKFILPSAYPILVDKSRINSTHRAKKILKADKQINIINKKQFNAVKYSVGFIEKRMAAKKSVKKKFDFDF